MPAKPPTFFNVNHTRELEPELVESLRTVTTTAVQNVAVKHYIGRAFIKENRWIYFIRGELDHHSVIRFDTRDGTEYIAVDVRWKNRSRGRYRYELAATEALDLLRDLTRDDGSNAAMTGGTSGNPGDGADPMVA